MITEKRLNEIKSKLRECIANGDVEMAHADADELLCELLIELGYKDIVQTYSKVEKWCA